MATKRRRTAPPRPPTSRVGAETQPTRRRLGWVTWLGVGVAAAAAAFLVAREQATGGGEVVEPPARGLPHTPDYHSLFVDPADPRRLLLGTHVGLYESRDGGESWKIAGIEGDDVMNLARAGDGTVWAAGHDVLAKSADGGRTWSDVRPTGLPSLDIHGFAIQLPKGTLFAAVAGEGLFRSKDGGNAFETVSRDVGGGVYGLAVQPGGRILAADDERGLLASADGRGSWQRILPPPVIAVSVSSADANRVLATGRGIRLSTDGGKTWSEVLASAEGVGPAAWSASHPRVAYAVGLDRKLYRSDDAGRTWKAVA